MHENNKSSKKILSDVALERVMLDVLSGIWEISPERAEQELSKNNASQTDGSEETEGS